MWFDGLALFLLAEYGLVEYGLAVSWFSKVRLSRFLIVDLSDSFLAKYGLADSCSVFYQIQV